MFINGEKHWDKYRSRVELKDEVIMLQNTIAGSRNFTNQDLELIVGYQFNFIRENEELNILDLLLIITVYGIIQHIQPPKDSVYGGIKNRMIAIP